MSQLFDNYKKGYQIIPDNEKAYTKIKTDYKDVLVLGADNNHTFVIPYSFDELLKIEITYIQGTEIKVRKVWDSSLLGGWFIEDPDIEEHPEIEHVPGVRLFTDASKSANLYELENDDTMLDYYRSMIDEEDWDSVKNLDKFCVIFYRLSKNEISKVNDYNKELYTQMTLTIDSADYAGPNQTTYLSDLYKINPVLNINLIGKDVLNKESD